MPQSYGRFILQFESVLKGVSFQKNYGKRPQVPNLSNQADHQVQFKTNTSCLGYSETIHSFMLITLFTQPSSSLNETGENRDWAQTN